MSISTQIERLNVNNQRIKTNVANAYSAIKDKGVSFKNLFDTNSYTWTNGYLTGSGDIWGSPYSLMPTDFIEAKAETSYAFSFIYGTLVLFCTRCYGFIL